MRALMTTANKITIVRIFLIPLFALMAIYYGQSVKSGHPQTWQWVLTIVLFISTAASDGIDGYIARRYNQRTRLGSILDPIADKGLLLTAIITLSFSNWIYEFPLWFPVLVVSRDAVILIGAGVIQFFTGTLDVKPSWLGKCATALQMLAIALTLLQWQHPLAVSGFHFNLLDIPVALAGIFTFLSGVGYVMDGIHQLQAGGHAN